MSDQLDRETVERMLRGEDTGPPKLAALLAAVSARPVRDDLRGEETAVRAFRAARAGVLVSIPSPRRLLRARLLAIKTALIGLLLMLAGGVAVAASPHLPEPIGGKHATLAPIPVVSQSATKRLNAPVRSLAPGSRDPGSGSDKPEKRSHHAEKTPPGWRRKDHPSKSHDEYGLPPDLRGLPPGWGKAPVVAVK